MLALSFSIISNFRHKHFASFFNWNCMNLSTVLISWFFRFNAMHGYHFWQTWSGLCARIRRVMLYLDVGIWTSCDIIAFYVATRPNNWLEYTAIFIHLSSFPNVLDFLEQIWKRKHSIKKGFLLGVCFIPLHIAMYIWCVMLTVSPFFDAFNESLAFYICRSASILRPTNQWINHVYCKQFVKKRMKCILLNALLSWTHQPFEWYSSRHANEISIPINKHERLKLIYPPESIPFKLNFNRLVSSRHVKALASKNTVCVRTLILKSTESGVIDKFSHVPGTFERKCPAAYGWTVW